MTEIHETLPRKQHAVQLVGAGQLRLNREKPVPRPGPFQVLARVEAVGLCFSDLKLIRQFAGHPRKGEVTNGLPEDILAQIPSYVPGETATVPGHEAVCRIVAVGPEVQYHNVGERVLVQTDYRALRTAGSNAAFGYNFEGALQEYVLMDERVLVDSATGERFLIPVSDRLSASAVALVEPWACVEESYVNAERRAPKAGGRMLVAADAGREIGGLESAIALSGKPAALTCLVADKAQRESLRSLGVGLERADAAGRLPAEAFDDIIYFGPRAETIETLADKLAPGGIFNVVLRGARIGRPVSIPVGRVHYGGTRWTGTADAVAADSYAAIPPTGEIRPDEKMAVIGAAGPMGQMHVIRALVSGVEGIEIIAADIDDARLSALARKVSPLAREKGVRLDLVNPAKEGPPSGRTYVALMAPVPALVAEAVENAAEGCLVNVFAGIPAGTRHTIDLDAYIAKRCHMFGTSGSTIGDMRIVLEKIERGRLDTNTSVAAVSGMAGAIEGLRAVENRALAGKIVVYPALHDLGLVPLSRLPADLPQVAAKLNNGAWCKAAEDELLRTGSG